jgi:hypothetical protein
VLTHAKRMCFVSHTDAAPSLTGPIVGGALVFIVAAVTAVVIVVMTVYMIKRYVLTVITYSDQ